jgi:hypothetical protein
MTSDAVVVWLAPAAREREGAASNDASEVPSEDAKRALLAWANARGVKLVLPGDEGGERVTGLVVDWATAERVERGLAHVRDALAGLEFDAAERELARAEAALREHPELPQAAWLRAEIDRAWSVRWLRGGDEERAKRAWQRAAGLDGGREAGLGEKAFAPDAPITATIELRGAGEAVLRIDGEIVPPGEIVRSAGEHALAILSPDGRTTYADWVSIAQGTVVRIEAPSPPACSAGDVKRARLSGDKVDATGVRCGAWVAAVAGTGSVVRVATCAGGACGELVEWRSIAAGAPGWTFGPGPAVETRARWPAWATWTLAGVGVVGTAVGIAAAAGAFRSSASAETQFVNGGIQVHSF